eukprot:Blabericola_migrator_1__7002@NODE_354_length_9484_cov_115_239354_g283_i0_p3_GENE_NODE_354_length_9484_cov_115_239354_g283_i0NODE_354_length_9484_cov_115_239354_g283_i0_p3_ORF_typecomplete_len503_score87_90Exostosin/PF03016_15/1_6e20_NODE_354_length_9484_cov_115_239354_g283_i052306738
MRLHVILVALDLAIAGTLPDGEFDPANSWIADASFFEDFNYLEKRKFFYPRGVGYLNDQPVKYRILDEHLQIEKLREACKGSTNRRDAVMHKLLEDHPWRTKDDKEATFLFVPTYAGAVFDGECGPDAEKLLAELMAELYNKEDFKQAHGQDHIMYSSSESVHERNLARARMIAKEFKAYDTSAMSKADPSVIDYMMSQMTTLETFYRPTMQYCQLFVPALRPADYHVIDTGVPPPPDPEHDDMDWETFKSHRPIEIAMLDTVLPDDRKYATRLTAFTNLSGEASETDVLVALADSKVANATECSKVDLESAGSKSLRCKLKDELSPLEVSQFRQQLFSKARFALITRGSTPHPEAIYDALQAGAIIINTVDKNLDMGLPFQCQVPWEDFTIRIATPKFDADPSNAVKEALQSLSTLDLTRKIKLAKYYRVDVLTHPGFGQTTLIVDNIMLNVLRRCQDEQTLALRHGTSRWNTHCPHMDYGKISLIKRTYHNCDLPPWHMF